MFSYNFLQSDTRKTIYTKVLWGDCLTFSFDGQHFFASRKTKKIWPFHLQFIQVLGVRTNDDSHEYLKRFVPFVKKHFAQYHSRWHPLIAVQIGLTQSLAIKKQFKTNDLTFAQQVKTQRIFLYKHLKQFFGLRPSHKENMPLSTIIIDLQRDEDQIFSSCEKTVKLRIKAAKKKWFVFRRAEYDQRESFYDIWHTVSLQKWFFIMPRERYLLLRDFLIKSGKGDLFLAMLPTGEILSGSLCILDGEHIIYLYGATNKRYGNIGGHHFLTYSIAIWWKQHRYRFFDLFGGAPTGYPDHSLSMVSTFKESFGGIKIDYYGNFDIVFSWFWYSLFVAVNWLKSRIKKLLPFFVK